MLINKRIEEPYNKMPKEESLQILSKPLIKSKLSKNFWNKIKHIYSSNFISVKNIKIDKNSELNINIINNGNKNLKRAESRKNNLNNNQQNLNLKNKRVKTPTMKHSNIRYMENNNINF